MEASEEFIVDNLIDHLLNKKSINIESTNEITQLCLRVNQIFLKEASLLELNTPINVCGAILGQFEDLLRLFEQENFPNQNKYLFLGGYTSRHPKSIEAITLLFAYKLKYPDNIYLIRGKHEINLINRSNGFYDNCKRKFNMKTWKLYNQVFDSLPIAALINEKIFCVFGGLSHRLETLEQIKSIKRPCEVEEDTLLCDLLLGTIEDNLNGCQKNDISGYEIGQDFVLNFIQKFNLNLIIRSHQSVENGYEYFANEKLVTIYSVPIHGTEIDHLAAIMKLSQDLTHSFKIIKKN